jgi:hypothetical protein
MRDTVITSRSKKRELYILLFAFIASNIMNLIGIAKYGTSSRELLSQIPVVILLTLFLYGVVVALRIIWWFFTGIYRMFNKS